MVRCKPKKLDSGVFTSISRMDRMERGKEEILSSLFSVATVGKASTGAAKPGGLPASRRTPNRDEKPDQKYPVHSVDPRLKP